ncbi:S8 family peptidase [Leptospira alexanderi]|uniref:Peptidase, S8/S53 family n=1 Tax=Leptospira alexanderi serovar Manhao 3 str. L 60 TaxID=1049759 RepID=V6ICN9_9LEPT|nr:S8 family peptidase [Leptospira alexanderi]EQA61973.1 peptidase, S8/S53 family [Leptospira alexanderi serovar Manhao 3 str. L 60]
MVNFNDKKLNDSIVNTLSDFCKERKIKFKEKSYTKSLSVFRLEEFSDKAFNELIQLDGILSIEPMPFVTVDLQSLAYQSSVEIKTPVADKQYPTIGFLDSGIANIPHLSPWIKDVSSPYPELELNKDHGTFCAGITVYGNELQGLDRISLDGCYLFDASVVPNLKNTRITEDELIDNIKEVILNFSSKIKIWNMSVGTNEEAKLNTFSDFGKVLDELQDNHNIIIIKSAGNCINFLNGLDPSRISRPADSVHALVVGSVAQSKNLNDISDINHRSPFSRIGPGPGFITKPELVHYGG